MVMVRNLKIHLLALIFKINKQKSPSTLHSFIVIVSHCSALFKLWSNFTEEGSLLAQLPLISQLTGISPSQLPPLKLVPSRPAYQICWMHFRSITWPLGITQHSRSVPAEVLASYSFCDTTITVLLQKKVTENSTQIGLIIIIVIIIFQIGLSNKKLRRLYGKSRGRAGIRVSSSSVSLGFS